MIEVVGQLGSDTEAILKTSETGTVVYKHVACQATSIHASEVSVPIMFCTMFFPICEASTQVNLPLTSCFKDFNRPPAVIQSFSTKNRESEPKPLDNIKPVKERKMCFQAPTYRKRKYEIDSALCDSKKPEDNVFMSPSIEEGECLLRVLFIIVVSIHILIQIQCCIRWFYILYIIIGMKSMFILNFIGYIIPSALAIAAHSSLLASFLFNCTASCFLYTVMFSAIAKEIL